MKRSSMLCVAVLVASVALWIGAAGCRDDKTAKSSSPAKATGKPTGTTPAVVKTSAKPVPSSPSVGTPVVKTPAPQVEAEPKPKPKPPWTTLKGKHDHYAFDPDAGALLGVTSSEGKATLYPAAYLEGKSEKVVGPTTVGAGVGSVVYKRYGDAGLFVLLRQAAERIEVLSAADLKSVREVRVPSGSRSLAVTAKAKDPMVYYIQGGAAARVRLDTFEDLGKMPLGASGVRISPGGEYLYLRDVARSDLCWVYARSSEAPGSWRRLRGYPKVPGTVLPAPGGVLLAIGRGLYEVDSGTARSMLTMTPRCFLRDQPMLLGVQDNRVFGVSTNTFDVCGVAALPDGFNKLPQPTPALTPTRRFAPARRSVRSRRQTPPSLPPVRLFADEKHGRVVAVCLDRAFAMPIDVLTLPDEPRVGLRLNVPGSVVLGETMRVPLKVASKACTVRLLDAPAGMTIDGDTLVWTPTDAQIGTSAAELEVRAGALARKRLVRVNVRRPYLQLPFVPMRLRCDRAGKRAVVWSPPVPTEHPHVVRARLVVIDLRARKVIAEMKTLYGIQDVAVDERYLYVARRSSRKIDVLSARDLSLQRSGEADFDLMGLSRVGSSWLMVRGNPETKRQCFELPDLVPTESVLLQSTHHHWRWRTSNKITGGLKPDWGSLPGRRVVDGRVYVRGCLYDPDLAVLRMPIRVANLPLFPPGVDPADRGRRKAGSLAVPVQWDRQVTPGWVKSGAGANVAQLPGNASAMIMAGVPVGVTLSVSKTKDGWISAALRLHELRRFKTVNRVTLLKQWRLPAGRPRARILSYRDKLADAGGRTIVTTVGDMLFVHTVTDETLKQCPRPFQMLALDAPVTLDVDKPTTISHRTVGGQGPVEFDLVEPRSHIAIDRKSGVVTVNGPELLREAVVQVQKELYKRMRARLSDGRWVSLKPEQRVDYLVRGARDAYREVTGREAKGVPWLLRIRLIATDAAGNLGWLDYQAFLEVPEVLLRPEPKPKPKPKPVSG